VPARPSGKGRFSEDKAFESGEYKMISEARREARKIIFKNPVRIAKKTLHFTIIKINWLTLFKEIIAVYCENHTKSIHI
jgi:hypothetical protein